MPVTLCAHAVVHGEGTKQSAIFIPLPADAVQPTVSITQFLGQLAVEVLFRSQQVWSVSGKVWETVAAVLTPEEQKKVQALAKDPAVLADVQRDVDRGTKAALNQTPTLMITYKLKQQPWANFADYSLFRGYIDALLKK